MTNHEIADIFELLSKLMDIHGANSFQSKSYASAAFKIDKLPHQLALMSGAERTTIPGLGSSLISKIDELLNTNKLSALENLLLATPPGILEIMKIKGIGPKKIALLWTELNIESIGELEYACNENRLITVKGFGAKTQESILKSIEFIKNNSGFFLYAEIESLVATLITTVKSTYPTHIFEVSGAYRRQVPTIDQLIFVSDLTDEQFRMIVPTAEREQVETVNLTYKIPQLPTLILINCNTHNVGSTLFETTNSVAFGEAFLKQYTVQETANELDIFTINGLSFIPPALRETKEIITLASKNTVPELIQTTDIKSIIHSHSTYSDGQHSLKEMAFAAKEKGFEYLVISDHSQAAFYANGLSPERIASQHIEIDALNTSLAPFKIFKSIEADILNDGSLDYNDQVLSTFDLVIASVHSNLKMTEEKAMIRLLKAIENPYTRILGHPTGRLLLSRAGYPLDHKKIIDACIANQVVIEINAHPRRLDLDWTWIDYALSKGALLSINPDAHSIDGMDLVKYGVLAAQKGGLTKDKNLSSYTLAEFEDFLKSK